MECYLDNAATTQVLPQVSEIVKKTMEEDYGNPSSLHRKGVTGEQYVRRAREQIAKTLKCETKNIIFTSGGTESNNMALMGCAMANRRRGKHIITTNFEHASVSQPLLYLEEMGFEITWLPVDEKGHLSPETLKKALREDTILVSVMLVNNEVGSVLDVRSLAETAHAYCRDILFHVDAIQAYTKMQIRPSRMGIDLMSVSGHKIHGPKGTGFLYRDPRVKMHPLIYGGGQQGGMRSGTENVPGIAGLGLAAEIMDRTLDERRAHMYGLKKYFAAGLQEIEGVVIHAYDQENPEETAPHILSASFPNIRSEVLLHALEEEGIYVSSGSACSSNHPGISGTLRAIGVLPKHLDSTLRFSFSELSTGEEADYTLAALKKLIPVLSRYTRK